MKHIKNYKNNYYTTTRTNDEGGYMAENDYLVSLYDELDNRCIDSDLMEQIDNFIEGDE